MAVRVAVLAALVASVPGIAAAGDVGGRYTAKGVGPLGWQFSGKAEIKMTSANTCRIFWSNGSHGVCLLDGTTLSVGYVEGTGAGLAIYEVRSDGTLDGVFLQELHPEIMGKETLTPIH